MIEMSPKTLRLRMAVLLGLMVPLWGAASEPWDWGDALASKLSGDWRKAQEDRVVLEAELGHLPEVSILDYGGPRGFRTDDTPGPKHPFYDDRWLQVRWKNAEVVDLVALVPARQFDEHGIDPNFEVPEDFQVVLVDEEGKTLKVLAEERDTRSDPVRKGHPFCYRVDPPLRCSGLRIQARRMYVDPARPAISHFMAWGEVFCFQGERNVAHEATVTSSEAYKSLWPWKSSYVVDEITGLGLAELQDSSHLEIGWLSSGVELQRDAVWVQVDLGSVRACDGIRLFPPERPRDFLIPGLYYPLRFVIEVSAFGKPGTYQTVFSHEEEDFDNPGHHAVTLHWPMLEARFVRVRSLALRRIAKNYPAFMGFSELQILHEGENIALNAAVDASEYATPMIAHGILLWSAQSLTDGYTSRGKILSSRQWMEGLQRRYEVESAMHRLDLQAAAIATRFRRGMTAVGAVLGGFMLAALIALPIRHRRREARVLRALRAQIAADLHDEIGSSMGSIQLLTEAALSKPELAADRLTTIRLLTSGSVASLRDIVWLLRPGSAFQSPVLGHFRETAAILLEGLEWDFASDEASRECRLTRNTNRQLLLLFREALHNCVRHARCRSIMIRTALEQQIFTLEVRDDGCGIAEEKLASPFCLRALKERTRHLEGTLKVTSAPGQGTTILLQFPITRTNSAKPS